MGMGSRLGTLLIGAVLLAGCEADLEGRRPAGDETEARSEVTPDQPGPSQRDDEIAALEAEVEALEREAGWLRGVVDERDQEVEELEANVDTLIAQTHELRDRLIDSGPDTLPPHTEEGLGDALRAYLPAGPWLPGLTRWRDSDLQLPPELTGSGSGMADHGELALHLVTVVVDAEDFGGPVEPDWAGPWEVTARALRTGEDEAAAVIQLWGWADDSVSGTDYRFSLRRGPDGWYVEGVEERNQCTRNDRRPGDDDLPELCV